MNWTLRRFLGALASVLFGIGILLSGCVGAAPIAAEPETATQTDIPTPFPTLPPTKTPTPPSTPTPSPTPTKTMIPTPTRDPDLPRVPTPELDQILQIPAGGFLFRQPLGYEVSVEQSQVNIYSEETGVVISFIGIKTPKHGGVENVMQVLLKALESRFEELTEYDLYSNPIDGFEGLAVPITGSLTGEKVSGLVMVISISKEQLFYVIALIPDGPEGPTWNVDGQPVLETLIGSIDFFPPIGQ